ncbi:MAG: hypothetical protein RLY71_1580 [Pseudomonadota bacterium]
MAWIEIVTVLALLQYLLFSVHVGQARQKYGVKAPAVTGHEQFERAYRVQMNTLEVLALFLPGLWLAAQHWSPTLVAALGAVYLVGRALYARSYVRDPARRGLGFVLSIGPAVTLLGAGLVGAVLAALK